MNNNIKLTDLLKAKSRVPPQGGRYEARRLEATNDLILKNAMLS